MGCCRERRDASWSTATGWAEMDRRSASAGRGAASPQGGIQGTGREDCNGRRARAAGAERTSRSKDGQQAARADVPGSTRTAGGDGPSVAMHLPRGADRSMRLGRSRSLSARASVVEGPLARKVDGQGGRRGESIGQKHEVEGEDVAVNSGGGGREEGGGGGAVVIRQEARGRAGIRGGGCARAKARARSRRGAGGRGTEEILRVLLMLGRGTKEGGMAGARGECMLRWSARRSDTVGGH